MALSTLTTPRLRLVPASLVHETHYVDVSCDAVLATAAGRPLAPSREAARLVFAKQLERQAEGSLALWMLELVADAHVVGAVSLRSVERAPHARLLGYELQAPYWGQGLMPEAVRAVVMHAFAAMRAHRIEATTGPTNVRSQRVLERCGFTREGVLRDAHHHTDGRFEDSVVYGRLATDA